MLRRTGLVALFWALTPTAQEFVRRESRSPGSRAHRVVRSVRTITSTRSRLGPVGAPLPSSANCTWQTFEQRLDHFSRGAEPATFSQRLCLYDFSAKENGGPTHMLFYTGNESPVEEYVNNTGLMWEVGAELGSLLVFAEHRYEGESVPELDGVPACLSYCTVEQALADYATVIDFLRDQYGATLPVVAVGGSYGGMLAGWFRMSYPSTVQGAIAASAPIWGLPSFEPRPDGSSVAIGRAFSAAGGAPASCATNLLGAWPVIALLEPEILQEGLDLCSAPRDGREIASAIQSVFFDLAEANYPFPSTYISSAVGPGYYPLPAWPIREACDALSEPLVEISGDTAAVDFRVTVDDLTVDVKWSEATNATALPTGPLDPASNLAKLLDGVKGVWATWCNVTGELECFGATGSCATGRRRLADLFVGASSSAAVAIEDAAAALKTRLTDDTCSLDEPYAGGSWGPLCCNDDINLYNTVVQGIGSDGLFWPPNTAPNTSLESIVGVPYGATAGGCRAGPGLSGYPATSDPWSRWLQAEFGRAPSAVTTAASNIVFSNGLFDPWSTAGVYPAGGPRNLNLDSYDGPVVVDIGTPDSDVSAVLLDYGAHHLDLMFMDDNDPPCAVEARAFETDRIKAWVGLDATGSPATSSGDPLGRDLASAARRAESTL